MINDIQDTFDMIVLLSDFPVSIIIVGVGDADFEQMCILDADEAPIYSATHKRFATRDIVQFVPYKNFAGNKQ